MESTDFEQAANGLDLRHRLACGWPFNDKPIISKKTLDDYQHQMDLAKEFDFEEHKDSKIKLLREISSIEQNRRKKEKEKS